MDRDDSPIKKYTPTIFPQGSIALGTVVKPVLKDECDVDIVCLLEKLSSDIVSPANVKQMVGKELKGHGTYFKMLDKKVKDVGHLHYSDKANFIWIYYLLLNRDLLFSIKTLLVATLTMQ